DRILCAAIGIARKRRIPPDHIIARLNMRSKSNQFGMVRNSVRNKSWVLAEWCTLRKSDPIDRIIDFVEGIAPSNEVNILRAVIRRVLRYPEDRRGLHLRESNHVHCIGRRVRTLVRTLV